MGTRIPRLAGIGILAAGAVAFAAALGGRGAGEPGGRVVQDGFPAIVRAPTGPSAAVSALTGAVVDGRFVRTVTVGGLEVAPDPSPAAAPLGLDLAGADELASLTEGLGTPQVVGFGQVTIAGAPPPSGMPALTRTAAWVAITPPGEAVFNCPAMTAPPASRPPRAGGHGVFRAVVFFGSVASAGPGAVLYASTGSLPCGGTARASLSNADAAVPVAWRTAGPVGLSTPVSYRAPSCSHLETVSTAGNVRTGVTTLAITVTVPFDRAGCATVQTFTTTVRAYPPSTAPGAPAPPSHVELAPKPLPTLPPVLVAPVAAR